MFNHLDVKIFAINRTNMPEISCIQSRRLISYNCACLRRNTNFTCDSCSMSWVMSLQHQSKIYLRPNCVWKYQVKWLPRYSALVMKHTLAPVSILIGFYQSNQCNECKKGLESSPIINITIDLFIQNITCFRSDPIRQKLEIKS